MAMDVSQVKIACRQAAGLSVGQLRVRASRLHEAWQVWHRAEPSGWILSAKRAMAGAPHSSQGPARGAGSPSVPWDVLGCTPPPF